jgi:hypothetical protein
MQGEWNHSPVFIWHKIVSFFWATIIVPCDVVIDACYTIFMRVGSTMIMSIKVRKPFLVIKISIHHQMWWRKRWNSSLWTCGSLCKVMVVIVFQSVSLATIRSLLHRHQSKWVFKLSMVWPHQQHERCTIIRYGKLRWVCSVVKKWVDDKQNVGVVGWANNQVLTFGLAYEWDVLMWYLKECLLEGKQTHVRVNDPPKKPTIRGKIEPLGSQRVGHESGHPGITWFKHRGVTWFKHLVVSQP